MSKPIRTKLGLLLLCALAVLPPTVNTPGARAQETSRLFPQTGHTVRGRFLQYWDSHGGLVQQGYPISDELHEVSPTDGKEYTVQYFERAVFEYHPENAPPYDVLLSLLGVDEYRLTYGEGQAPNQQVNADQPSFFAQTGHSIGGTFRAYWESHGRLAQQGYPISDEFTGYSPLDGKPYTVQYFQRAVFELHPENAGTPYEVLLSQLGTLTYRDRDQPPRQALPLRPGYRQGEPVLSADYLVWNETTDPSSAGTIENTADLFARDLHSGQTITVSDALGDEYEPAIAGSLVVWSGGTCCGARDIRGKDLATGRSFNVATGPADQTLPAIAGHTVAWTEYGATGAQIKAKDLDSGLVTTVSTLTTNQASYGRPVINDDYVVWAEEPFTARGDIARTPIRFLDRHTGAVRTAITAVQAGGGRPYPDYALADHRLIWTDNTLNYTDLVSGETRVLWDGAAYSPQILGDTVVWVSPATGAFTVWGMHLSDGVARILVGGRGVQGGVALNDDILAWANDGGPFSGRITTASLAAAFAGSMLPPPPPTPAPPGTARPPGSPVPQFTETTEPGAFPMATAVLPEPLPTGTAEPLHTATPRLPKPLPTAPAGTVTSTPGAP